MATFIRLPHCLWIAVILPLLDIRDFTHLRSVSRYCNFHVTRICRTYHASLAQSIAAFTATPAFTTIQRIMTEAADFLEREMKKWLERCLGWKLHRQRIWDAHRVLSALLGTKLLPPGDDVYTQLKNLTEVTEPELVRWFLQTYDAAFLRRGSSVWLVHRYLVMVEEAVPLQTKGYVERNKRVKAEKQQEKVLARLLHCIPFS